MIISKELIGEFETYLIEEEKSKSTIECYLRNINAFFSWICGQEVTKQTVLEYKALLTEQYKPATVNAILSAMNSFFDFFGAPQLKVKTIKLPKEIFYSEEKELTKKEYERLLCAAKKKKNQRLYYIMQTICASGIRVSELEYITVEAVKRKYAEVKCKGKIRKVYLSNDLCTLLMRYLKTLTVMSGSIFVTRSGKPINRSNLWHEMRALCKEAGVSPQKVFPHNLRHLFARTYYTLQKDIVRLADILGHSSINTTRIYTKEAV